MLVVYSCPSSTHAHHDLQLKFLSSSQPLLPAQGDLLDSYKCQALKWNLENFNGKSWVVRVIDHRATVLDSPSHQFFSPGSVPFKIQILTFYAASSVLFNNNQPWRKCDCDPSKSRIGWITDNDVWFLYESSYPVSGRCQICALQ